MAVFDDALETWAPSSEVAACPQRLGDLSCPSESCLLTRVVLCVEILLVSDWADLLPEDGDRPLPTAKQPPQNCSHTDREQTHHARDQPHRKERGNRMPTGRDDNRMFKTARHHLMNAPTHHGECVPSVDVDRIRGAELGFVVWPPVLLVQYRPPGL